MRECFEESGLLLAKKKGDDSGVLIEVGESERERARREIHSGKLRFVDWVEGLGGVIDSGMFFQKFPLLHLLHRFAAMILFSKLSSLKTSWAQNLTTS